MSESYFQISEDPTAHLIRFMMPPTIDTLEIDALITDVMSRLDPKPNELWVIDLSEVAYMGSSMLGLMVNIRERIRRSSGKLALCGLSTQLAQVFKACCLERLFTIAKTRDEAKKMLGAR